MLKVVQTAINERVSMFLGDSMVIEIEDSKCKIVHFKNCEVLENGPDDIRLERQRAVLLPLKEAIQKFDQLKDFELGLPRYQYTAVLGCHHEEDLISNTIFRYDVTVYDPDQLVGEINALVLNSKINSNLHFPYNPENGFFNNITMSKSDDAEKALSEGLGQLLDESGKKKARLDLYPKIQNQTRLLGPQSQDFTTMSGVHLFQYPDYTVFAFDFAPGVPIMYIHPREKSRADRIAYSGKPSQVLSLDLVQNNRKYLKLGDNHLLVYGQKPSVQYKDSTCFILVDLARNEYETGEYNSGILDQCASLEKFGIKGETLMIACTLQPNPELSGFRYSGGLLELQLNLNPLVVVATYAQETQQLLNYTYEQMDGLLKSVKYTGLQTDWDVMNPNYYLVSIYTEEQWKTEQNPVHRVYRIRMRKMTVEDIRNKTGTSVRLTSQYKYTAKDQKIVAVCDIEPDVVLWALSDGSVVGSSHTLERVTFRSPVEQASGSEELVKHFCLRKSKMWVLVYSNHPHYWRYLVLNANAVQASTNRVFAEEWITTTGRIADSDMLEELKFQSSLQLFLVSASDNSSTEPNAKFTINKLMYLWVQFNRRYPMLNLDTAVLDRKSLPCSNYQNKSANLTDVAGQLTSLSVNFSVGLGAVRGSRTQKNIPISLTFDCPEPVRVVQLKTKVKPAQLIPLKELVDVQGEVFSLSLLQNYTQTFAKGIEVRYVGKYIRQFYDPNLGKIGKLLPTADGMFIMSRSNLRHYKPVHINGSFEYDPDIERSISYSMNPTKTHSQGSFGVFFYSDSFKLISLEIDEFDCVEIISLQLQKKNVTVNQSVTTIEENFRIRGHHAIIRDYDYAVLVYDFDKITVLLSDDKGHNSGFLDVTTADLNVTSMLIVQDCFATKLAHPYFDSPQPDSEFAFMLISLRRSELLKWVLINYRKTALDLDTVILNKLTGTFKIPGISHGIIQKIECAMVTRKDRDMIQCFFGTSSSFDVYVEFFPGNNTPITKLVIKLQKPEQGKIVDIDQCSRGNTTYLYSVLETTPGNVTVHQYEIEEVAKVSLNNSFLRASKHFEIYDFDQGRFACFGDRFFIKTPEEMVFEYQTAEPAVLFKQTDNFPSDFRLKFLGYGYSDVLRFELKEPSPTYFVWVYSLAGITVVLFMAYLLSQVWYRLKKNEIADEAILNVSASRASSGGSHKASTLDYWRDKFHETSTTDRPTLQPFDDASFKKKLIDSALLKSRYSVGSR